MVLFQAIAAHKRVAFANWTALTKRPCPSLGQRATLSLNLDAASGRKSGKRYTAGTALKHEGSGLGETRHPCK
jgi:hypothetical protein